MNGGFYGALYVYIYTVIELHSTKIGIHAHYTGIFGVRDWYISAHWRDVRARAPLTRNSPYWRNFLSWASPLLFIVTVIEKV